MWRLYWAACGLFVVIGCAVWLRADAQSDQQMRSQAQQARDRIEHIQKSNEVTNEIHSLDGDALSRELDQRLSGGGNRPN
jgi:Fe-S cluster assembly ATPase SufC